MQSCVWLVFIIILAVYQDIQLLFCRVAAGQSVPILCYFVGILYPRCRTLHLLLLNFIRFLLDHSSSLLGSLWEAVLLSCVKWSPRPGVILPSCFRHSSKDPRTQTDKCANKVNSPTNFLKIQSLPSPRSLTKRLNRIASTVSPEEHDL